VFSDCLRKEQRHKNREAQAGPGAKVLELHTERNHYLFSSIEVDSVDVCTE